MKRSMEVRISAEMWEKVTQHCKRKYCYKGELVEVLLAMYFNASPEFQAEIDEKVYIRSFI